MNAMSIDPSPVQNDQARFDLPPLELIFGKDNHNSRFNKECGNEVTQPCVVKSCPVAALPMFVYVNFAIPEPKWPNTEFPSCRLRGKEVGERSALTALLTDHKGSERMIYSL